MYRGFNNNSKKKLTYEISLRFLVSLGLVNLPIKFVTRFIFTLETDKNRLIETDTLAAAITATDAANLWHDRYIKYEQIRLDENFSQYFEGIIQNP